MENIFDEIQSREYEPEQRYQQERDSPSFADDDWNYSNEQENEYAESDPNLIIKANHIQPGNSHNIQFKVKPSILSQNYNHFGINGISKEKVKPSILSQNYNHFGINGGLKEKVKPSILSQNYNHFGINGISKEKVNNQNNIGFKVPNQAIKYCPFMDTQTQLCCDGNVYNKQNFMKCCGDKLYNMLSKKCYDGKIMNTFVVQSLIRP